MPAASEPVLPLAVLGVGKWGTNILRVLRANRQVEVAALSDPRVPGSRGLGEILKDSKILACVVATPPETHARLACEALAAGKHVFIEKPLALSVREALWIRRSASPEARVMVGHLLHYHPALKRMVALIEAGAIGRLTRLDCQRGGQRIQPLHAAWWSLAPHDISLAPWLLGGPIGSLETRLTSRGIQATAESSTGAAFSLEVFATGGPKRRLIRAEGTQGALEFDDSEAPGRLTLQQDSSVAPSIQVIDFELREPLACEIEHFVSCLLTGTPFRTGLEQGLEVVRQLEHGWEQVELAESSLLERVTARMTE